MKGCRSPGFTLVELLVALALGGLVLGGAVEAVGPLASRHREADRMARLQEKAHFVLAVLEPEIQMAGYGGLRPLAGIPWAGSVPDAVRNCGFAAAIEEPALRVDSERYPFACPAAGGGAWPGSDALTIVRASARSATLRAGRVQVLSSRAAGGPQSILSGGRLPDDLALREGLHELRDFNLAGYYVSRDSDGAPGTPALRIKELIEIAGRPAIRDTEVASGVERLHIEEGWRTTDADTGGLEFGPPGARPPLSPLAAVRVEVHLLSDGPAQARLRTVAERTFALRNLRDPSAL